MDSYRGHEYGRDLSVRLDTPEGNRATKDQPRDYARKRKASRAKRRMGRGKRS
jgi:hypothetical protein